jgi:hypothetical protein
MDATRAFRRVAPMDRRKARETVYSRVPSTALLMVVARELRSAPKKEKWRALATAAERENATG